MMSQPDLFPTWAPRVKRHLLGRLYENDAQGIQDEELLNEVGWGLYERCKSFILANEAVRGRAPCPVCGATILHHARPDENLRCPSCGWECSWKSYFQTIQHKQLSGADKIIAAFQDYIDRYPAARTTQEKMLLIDILIHSWHWNIICSTDTRAAGINLIEGSYHEVIDFLDGLSYGPRSTPGAAQRWEEWRERVNQTAKMWGDQRLHRPEKE
jgi:predicted RNA-binding Zn-ribbon protein involved in translation (DUF1610 family)